MNPAIDSLNTTSERFFILCKRESGFATDLRGSAMHNPAKAMRFKTLKEAFIAAEKLNKIGTGWEPQMFLIENSERIQVFTL